MKFAHRVRRLLRSLLIAFLVLCGMLPSLIQAEIWSRTATCGMKDVAVAPDGIIWLTDKNGDNGILWKFATGRWSETAAKKMEDVAIAPDSKVWVVGKNGTIWFSSDQGQSFLQIEGRGFSRISAGLDSVVWAAKTDGTLWKLVTDSWSKIAVNGIVDIAIAPNGLIWLAEKDGAVWCSSDNGITFSQYEEVGGLENIAAMNRGAWAVGFDGTLWHKFFSPQF